MLVSIDWIKDFVELPNITSKEIGDRFTLGAAEVEEIKIVGEHLEMIRVAEVLKVDKHPDADKLTLVTFKLSDQVTKKVVCGAKNVTSGMKVPYAPLGTKFPKGLVLEPKKIRGIVSEGMLCSEEELGFSEEASGIMSLPKDAPLGETLLEYLKQSKDIIMDIDNKSLTHRPDLWGHYGMAREFAAIFEKPLNNPYDSKWAEELKAKFNDQTSPVVPRLEGESACIGYYGLTVKNIKVTESPDWMKRRLIAVGLRPINNIVDISNYLMMELGIPLHIFDADLIKGNEVIIKKLGEKASFVTLDEEKRELIESDTVICDSSGPLVIGGIMGGLSSGVTEKTKTIFIEVANWKPYNVRKTSNRLGLRTDSSQRYEKSLDTLLLERSMLRTLQLVLEFNPQAQVVGKLEYDGIDLNAIRPLKINTTCSKIVSVLGIEITKEKIIEIFNSLDFQVEDVGDSLCITVPSYRATKDVEYLDDLTEEIGRIIGYDNIIPKAPALNIVPASLQRADHIKRKIKDFFVYHGKSFEVMTYPLVGQKLIEKAQWPNQQCCQIINSISKDHDRMRQSMVPSLMEAMAKNVKYHPTFRFFEFGRSYLPDDKNFSEEHNQLGVVFFHKDQNLFLDLSNIMERLLDALNLPGDFVQKNQKIKNDYIPENWRGTHPYEYFNIRVMGKIVGAITSIHPIILNSYKVKGHVALAILDLHSFENQKLKEKIKFKSLPKFPISTFDWTVVANKNVSVVEALKAIKKVKIKEMASVKIADVFSLNEKEKTITLRATFSDSNGTLSGEFIDAAKHSLVSTLEKAGFPLKM